MDSQKMTISSPKGGISAVVHRPDVETDRLAILCPGYLDTKDYAHLVGLAQELRTSGYTAVRFDPTGTWESAGSIFDYTTTQYLEDIQSVLAFMLADRAYKTILLCGHSRGGSVSILYAARDPRVSGVVGIMPSAKRAQDEPRTAKWRERGVRISRRDLPDDASEMKEYHVPYSYLIDKERYDVLASVETIRVPMILVAGELDDIVLPSHVQEIYEHTREPKKLLMLAGIGHDYRRDAEDVRFVNGEILRSLREFNFV